MSCEVDAVLFLTMNATKEFYDKAYKERFGNYAQEFKLLNGNVTLYPCYNTLQVNDYSKFDMSSFSEEKKKKSREECFSIDLENVFQLGKKLST